MSQPGRRSLLPWLVAGGSTVVAVVAIVVLIVVLNSDDGDDRASSGSSAARTADTNTPRGVAEAAANALNDNHSDQIVTLACPAGKDWVSAKITRIDDVAGRDSFQATVKPGATLVVGDYYAEAKIELTYAGMPTDRDDDDDDDDDSSDDIGLKMGKENGTWCIAWLDD